MYWTNFNLPSDLGERRFTIGKNDKGTELDGLSKFHDYDFKKYKGSQFINKIGRNLVDYKSGEVIFNTARGILSQDKGISNQSTLF